MSRHAASRRHSGATGQGLVEFVVVMPVFLVLLAGMLEFGLAFSDRLTLGNATREGARIGAALATGSETSCTGDPSGVDTTVVASLQNILKSGGSDVIMANIQSIRIFKANSTGHQVGGFVNVWTYTPGSGPDADPGPGSEIIDFSPSSVAWLACTRSNATPNPDSIGISIVYDYRLQTPLGSLMSLLGGSQGNVIHIVDSTVMALNPTG
ncbi:MAG: TadE/TadG family type IV pilus assembly protein [Mycobacterium sp.]